VLAGTTYPAVLDPQIDVDPIHGLADPVEEIAR
jgi:hypothetical protein